MACEVDYSLAVGSVRNEGAAHLYAGADGCRSGWLAIRACRGDGARLRAVDVRVVPSFAALLELTATCEAVAVDIPIGLSEDGRREADFEARRRIGVRRSSVFPPPARSLLHAGAYAEANELSKQRFSRGLQRQTFNILPKMREADAAVSPEMQGRVVESHPEVSFWALAGERPLRHAKRTAAGRAERLTLLERAFGAAVRALKPPPGAAWDDLYDACVLAWTAARVAEGRAVRLPAEPQRDGRGLRMEIVY